MRILPKKQSISIQKSTANGITQTEPIDDKINETSVVDTTNKPIISINNDVILNKENTQYLKQEDINVKSEEVANKKEEKIPNSLIIYIKTR